MIATRFLSEWYYEKTLPVWRALAVDQEQGGFHEKLNASLVPETADGKRMMVQARQIFVFSQAYLRTQNPIDLENAKCGFQFLSRYGPHAQGGWHHKVDRKGNPVDPMRSLYDHAFVLFAMAWFGRANGSSLALDFADATIDFMETEMAHPKGGYVESVPGAVDNLDRPKGPRKQNPHMHLLEAFLALFQTSGDDWWLERASRIVALLKRYFFVEGSLREYFTDTWAPVPGPMGRITEPGHHYEWVWLLHQYAALTNDISIISTATDLYHFANANGVDEMSGGVFDEISASGEVIKPFRRLWPQTEILKAHSARRRFGEKGAACNLEQAIETLHENHLEAMPNGAWREHLGKSGEPIRTDFPGSSLYHLAMAVAEIDVIGDTGITFDNR